MRETTKRTCPLSLKRAEASTVVNAKHIGGVGSARRGNSHKQSRTACLCTLPQHTSRCTLSFNRAPLCYGAVWRNLRVICVIFTLGPILRTIAFGDIAKVSPLVRADWLVEEGWASTCFVIGRARFYVTQISTVTFGNHLRIRHLASQGWNRKEPGCTDESVLRMGRGLLTVVNGQGYLCKLDSLTKRTEDKGRTSLRERVMDHMIPFHLSLSVSSSR